jgi:hypothetical protein
MNDIWSRIRYWVRSSESCSTTIFNLRIVCLVPVPNFFCGPR